MPKRIVSPLSTGDKQRDREKRRIILVKNDITPTEIASELGITSQAVSNVVHCWNNSRRVLEYLEKLPVQA